MISRKGEDTDSRTAWLPMIVFAVILILALIALWRFDVLGKIGMIVPSYNQTVNPNTNGTIILAFDLKTNEVSYYTGTAFVVFPSTTTRILGKEFDVNRVRQTFQLHYRSSREGVANYTSLAVNDLLYPNQRQVPTLGGFIISPYAARGISDTLRAQVGEHSVFGLIGNYRSLHNQRVNGINPGAVPVLFGSGSTANNDLATRVYGAFILTQSDELYVASFPVSRDLTFEDVKSTTTFNYKKYESTSAFGPLSTLASNWRDSIYANGQKPTQITIPYKIVKGSQDSSQTVSVERDGTKAFVRLS